ncbi:MAG: carboxypeptidase-like regulatory domain-containing protein [Planctomycetaceae bacterium]|jgi:hypothetical protein|nr:carboxypeptidase-like regulatory domain-containing protein [Planctomycetaceae bacterium]
MYKKLLLIIFVLSFVAGCGREQKPADLPKLYPCRVTIQMKGTPLDGALVSLLPENGKWSAAGMTDAQGIVKLSTQTYSGVAEGTYKVTVSKNPVLKSSGTDSEVQRGANGEVITPPPLVAETFSDASKTTLKCEVKPGENSFEFSVEPPKR